MNIVGFDFSINKPAACLYIDGTYTFWSWPFGISERIKEIYREASVNLIDRTDEKYKGKDSSEKMRWEVQNSIYLSTEISQIFFDSGVKNTYIVFEGLSYGSSGNMGIQLGGYKYTLMKTIFDWGIPFDRMYTYAPITIKKTARCSKKGSTKADMINAFIKQNVDIPLRNKLEVNPEIFQKRTGTWIEHLDDLIDSFWAVETFREKNPSLL